MMRGLRLSLATRIRMARLEYAVMRLESAFTLGLIIVGSPAALFMADAGIVPPETWLGVLAFGLIAELALVSVSLSDAGARASQTRSVLHSHFGVDSIADPSLRESVISAVDLRARMQDVLGRKGRVAHDQTKQTVASVDGWLHSITRLAKRLNRFGDEMNLQSEKKQEVERRIADLEIRISQATDNKVEGQLRETIAGYRHQLRVIGELESLVERGELRLEHAVGALGTIHTQLTIFAARGMDAVDANLIAQEISDEIGQVDAVLSAMDRVFEAGHSPMMLTAEGEMS